MRLRRGEASRPGISFGEKIEEEFGGFQGGCGEQNLIRLETQAIVRNFWIELG